MSVGQFASFGGTCTCVAEVGAFIDMALCAACTLLAVPIDAEGSTNWGSWRDPDMGIATVRIGAIAFGKVQAGGCSLWGQFM